MIIMCTLSTLEADSEELAAARWVRIVNRCHCLTKQGSFDAVFEGFECRGKSYFKG